MSACVAAVLAASALFAPAVSRASAPDETTASIAGRMRMHIENAGMRWTDEPIIAADQFSQRAAGTVGQAQAFLLDLAESERDLVVTKVELDRSPDTLLHRGAPVLVTVTGRLAGGARDDAVRRAQWTMPALMALFLRGLVQSHTTYVVHASVADGAFQMEGRSEGAAGIGPVVKALGAGPGKLVTAAEVKQSKAIQKAATPGGPQQEKDMVVYSFTVTGTYNASNSTVDALKAIASE